MRFKPRRHAPFLTMLLGMLVALTSGPGDAMWLSETAEAAVSSQSDSIPQSHLDSAGLADPISFTSTSKNFPVGERVVSQFVRLRKNAGSSPPVLAAVTRQDGSPSPSRNDGTQDDGTQGNSDQNSATPAQDQPSAENKGDYPEPAKVDPQQLAQWQAQYDEDLAKWREITRRLLEIRSLYANCTRDEADAYVMEWEKKQAAGNELIESLTATGFELLKVYPRDEAYLRFVTAMVARLYNEDRFAEVFEMGKFLLTYPEPHNMLYGQVGLAAFAMNDFVEAAPLLRKAMELGSNDDRMMQYEMIVDKIQDYWEQELDYRKRDAAGEPLPIVKFTTSQGDIIIELFENDAPKTVGNFVHLVESGFYDGLIFHRVLPGFMAQTGCPEGTGTGGPGYTIPSECQGAQYRRHFGGVVSMANSGDPDSGGSQFFFTFVPTPHLDAAHTVFGRILEGQDVLPKLQRIDPTDPSVAGGADPDRIIKAEVLAKRDHEYVPAKNEKSR